MKVALSISDNFLSDDKLKTVHEFIEHIPELYAKGKSRLLEIKDTDEVVKFFIEYHLDELPDECLLKIFNIDSIKKITSELFINIMSLGTVSIDADSDDKINATLDFTLSEEYTDGLLVVRFNQKYEIEDIAHES